MPSINPKNLLLEEVLKQIKTGEMVIPDFQRKFVWDPESVRELLVSVVQNYYIGAMLSISSPSNNPDFAIKLVEGVDIAFQFANFQPQVNIILDGQQRLTSLFYAVYQPNGMTLKNQKNPYRYFLNIKKLLDDDLNGEDIIEGVSGNHRNRLVSILKDPDFIEFPFVLDIRYLVERFKGDPRLNKIIDVNRSILSFQITFLELPFGTKLYQIVETFERINKTGKPLTVFELLTARLYREKIKLGTLLEESLEKYPDLEKIEPETVLRVICLLRNLDYSRASILDLDGKDFHIEWEKACEGIKLALNKLQDCKTGFGVYKFEKIMPFKTMLIPLSAILILMKDSKKINANNYKKISKWYWISVFTERYTQSTNSVGSNDYHLLKKYIIKDEEPEYIKTFNISSIQIDVDTSGSAIFKGIFSLLALNGVKDFLTHQSIGITPDSVQDDHIFPKSKYKDDSVLNRTLISTNQKKSKTPPSKYFKALMSEQNIRKNKLIESLSSHFISEVGFDALLKDDLNALKEDRRNNLLLYIEKLLS